MEPFEIIAAPYDVWVAPTGTAFPLLTVAPAVPWARLGTRGNMNISEDGITVAHEEEIEEFRMLGATGPVKAARVSEGLSLSFVLHDLTLEAYQAVLGFNPLTSVPASAGVPGSRSINLYRGAGSPPVRSLLLRGPGPYGAAFPLQYELRRCYFRAEAEVVYSRGEPAGLEISCVALIDTSAPAGQEFGVLRAQTTVPL